MSESPDGEKEQPPPHPAEDDSIADTLAGPGPPFWCRRCRARVQAPGSRCSRCSAPASEIDNVSNLLIERRRRAPWLEARRALAAAQRRVFSPDSPDPPPRAME